MKALALAAALISCAPNVDPTSMARLVDVESHGHELAIHDNATDTEYEPASLQDALATWYSLKADSARRCAIARARGRYCLIDVGIAQVDESNFDTAQIARMFDAKQNLQRGSALMLSAWRTAVWNAQHSPAAWKRYIRLYGAPGLTPEQIVLRAAYSIYNSNTDYGNPTYVARIEQAGSDGLVRDVAADISTLRSEGYHAQCEVSQ